MSSDQHPQPPQMHDSPETVIAWGEYLEAQWRAAPDHTREEGKAWRALTNFYACWGKGLLKEVRQGLEATKERDRYEAELTAAAQELQNCPPVGRPEPYGPLDVVAGIRGVLAENKRLWQCLDILRPAVKSTHAGCCPAMDISPDPGQCTCGAHRIAAALQGRTA